MWPGSLEHTETEDKNSDNEGRNAEDGDGIELILSTARLLFILMLHALGIAQFVSFMISGTGKMTSKWSHMDKVCASQNSLSPNLNTVSAAATCDLKILYIF